ncbi:nucleotidyl transferase [Tetrasphaera phage TJE1]|uniref:Nucleotidyl transferase n=1 Tax=Tetrasphaera phage TJE1 TaxID=981335 RepID=G4W941_9CAUD|nr:nucleotidyl transferase [Tetrasphaera phage TJE1]ADX42529.1 nucleotidyl transferase [Tetrasphaera phage TJE1]
MGEGAAYIPKALVPLGNRRAIDWIIYRHQVVAEKFIIGTGRHHDLLESYVKANYSGLDIEFSYEDEPQNNAISTMLALDHADSRIPTIITFCDLLILSPQELRTSYFALASQLTKGVTGTFRHKAANSSAMIKEVEPSPCGPGEFGVLGWFYFEDTRTLKELVYGNATSDFTTNVVMVWQRSTFGSPLEGHHFDKVFEFGTESDLAAVRKLWEEA